MYAFKVPQWNSTCPVCKQHARCFWATRSLSDHFSFSTALLIRMFFYQNTKLLPLRSSKSTSFKAFNILSFHVSKMKSTIFHFGKRWSRAGSELVQFPFLHYFITFLGTSSAVTFCVTVLREAVKNILRGGGGGGCQNFLSFNLSSSTGMCIETKSSEVGLNEK